MRKRNALAAVFAVACVTATGAVAAQPDNPGCFGRDRAAYATENGSLGNEVGGVGYYASLRAGDNGEINQAYKDSCGG
jgi:hypothetical protein